MKKHEFIFNNYQAIIIIPDNFNGKWIWKTEFFYAFDKAERDLLEIGYARVYYQISDMYGSERAINLMYEFHQHIVKEYNLENKAILFGFSRGGLYAFNYALAYPDFVDKVYLDAPVLDLRTWPVEGSIEQTQLFNEYGLNKETIKKYNGFPIDKLKEYFSKGIPTLLIAGVIDDVVPFKQNSKKMIEFCKNNNIYLIYYLKKNCKHHPHSIEKNTKPILDFILYI